MTTDSQAPIRVRIEIAPDREPIEGVVRDERGSEQRFTGWLALMARLEVLRAGAPR